MKITNITRPDLFYSKYDTRLTIESKGIGWVRWYRTVGDLWKRIQTEKVEQYRYTHPADVAELTRDDVVKLFLLKQLIENNRKGNTVAYTHNSVHFYVNSHNHEIIRQFVDYATDNKLLIEAQVVAEKHPDVIYLKNPKHKHRVYLRAKTYDAYTVDKLKSEFTEYLNKYTNTFHPCQALTKWLEADPVKYLWYSRNVQNSHFIEYDDTSAITMLAMCFPDLIGKRYQLESTANRP
jgi:hypothetical protein